MRNRRFRCGELVWFNRDSKTFHGYISSMPQDNDPYKRYTVKSIDGTYNEKEVGEKLLHELQLFGCTMYHELLQIC